MSKHTAQITVRVPEETMERINQIVERAPWQATFGSTIRSSDIIREALRRGLDDLEKELEQKKK